MEENYEENSKNLTTNNIIESIKNAIKLIPVHLNDDEIKLPIFYNANASIAYHEAFEETKDFRKAFCIMVLQIVDDMKGFKFNKDEFPILCKEDIEGICDNDLQKIADAIISESESLRKFYKNDGVNYFENFNVAMLSEKKMISKNIIARLNPMIEMAKRVNKSYVIRSNEFQKINAQITPGLTSLLKTLDHVHSIKNMDKILGIASSFKPQMNNQNNRDSIQSQSSTMKQLRMLKSPGVRTNELLTEVSQGLDELNKLQIEQFKSNIKINEGIANTLIEEQYARKLHENEEKVYQLKIEKQNKINFKINILILIVSTAAMVMAVSSFLGYDRVYKTVKILLSLIFK